MKFGAEFREARAAADRLGCQVVLGDRPIEITLKRAWAALGPEERGAVLLAGAGLVFGLRLSSVAGKGTEEGQAVAPSFLSPPAAALFASGPSSSSSSTATTVAAAKAGAGAGAGQLEVGGYQGADDALLASLERFGQTFPALFEALIGERDRFLAWAVKRSKAVNGAPKVVAVMGALHLPGVVAAVRADNGGNTLSFRGVARLPPPSSSSSPSQDGGVALSPAYRKLLGRALGAWVVKGLPRFVRDVAVGTVVLEGAKLGYAQAAPQLEGWWAEAVGLLPLESLF